MCGCVQVHTVPWWPEEGAACHGSGVPIPDLGARN